MARLSGLGSWIEEDVAPDSTTRDLLAGIGALDEGEKWRPSDDWWSPFELAVHRRTGKSSFQAQLSRDKGPPPPAFATPRGGEKVQLPSPLSLPVSLEDALRSRRSRRGYASRALRLIEVSSLLWHSARVITTRDDPGAGELVFRPFAAGGARNELEIYLVANDTESLDPGPWRYDPRAHSLERVKVCAEGRARLNAEVQAATGGELSGDPPAVLIITAVFARMAWKYPDLALSLIYKDVGCLFQTLYLVCTALGLAPCAVGGGRESTNARWLGLDPLQEPQVGCFLVGPAAES